MDARRNQTLIDRLRRLEAALAQAQADVAELALLLGLEDRRASWPATTSTDLSTLSSRELEVLRHVTQGLRTRQIAKRLFISGETVRSHLKSLYRKLGVNSQVGLVELFRREVAVTRPPDP